MGYEQAVAKKQQQLWEGVPADWRIDVAKTKPTGDVRCLVRDHLSGKERNVTNGNAIDLLRKLRQGDVSAQEVTAAFAHRAHVAHQYVCSPLIARGGSISYERKQWRLTSQFFQTSCLAANNWPAAQQRACDLDSFMRTHGRPVGALHGLPVSVMDRFHVRDLDSACGFAAWVGSVRTAEDEGTLIRVLHGLGAVVHCKTNVPMSLMLGEKRPLTARI